MIISSERLGFIKSSLPPELFTHEAYLKSLGTLADALLRLAQNPAAALGQSVSRFKKMLAAMLVHASEDCQICAKEHESGLGLAEAKLCSALGSYNGSRHARASSLITIAYVFPPPQTRDAPEAQVRLIPALISAIDRRVSVTSGQQYSVEQASPQATA